MSKAPRSKTPRIRQEVVNIPGVAINGGSVRFTLSCIHRKRWEKIRRGQDPPRVIWDLGKFVIAFRAVKIRWGGEPS